MGNKAAPQFKSQKFFNEIPHNNANDQNQIDLREKVKLNLFLQNCKSSNEYYIKIFHFNDNKEVLLGETEKKKPEKDNLIVFPTTYILEYFFEKEQKLIFKIYNNEKEIIFNSTLGAIVGSRHSTLEKKISDNDNEILKIISKKYEDNYKGDFDISNFTHLLIKIYESSKNPFISGKDILRKYYKFKDIDKFFFKISSNQDLYKSELINDDLFFNKIRIPLDFLKPNFNIEFINYKSKKTLLKVDNLNIDKFFAEKIQKINLNYSSNDKMDITIDGELINRKNGSTFLNYIEEGLEIGLGIGIDFTGSSYSLHKGEGLSNQYETAIRFCGDIVANYDNDKKFPVYGFGAKLNNSSLNKMAFPINFKKNPEIYTIDNVIKEYHECLKKITLSGPTEYHHIFKYFINSVIEENNPNKYNTTLFSFIHNSSKKGFAQNKISFFLFKDLFNLKLG